VNHQISKRCNSHGNFILRLPHTLGGKKPVQVTKGKVQSVDHITWINTTIRVFG